MSYIVFSAFSFMLSNFCLLQRQCRVDIDRYCHNQEGEKVLECLMNSKIVRILSPKCQKVSSAVIARLAPRCLFSVIFRRN